MAGLRVKTLRWMELFVTGSPVLALPGNERPWPQVEKPVAPVQGGLEVPRAVLAQVALGRPFGDRPPVTAGVRALENSTSHWATTLRLPLLRVVIAYRGSHSR